MNANRDIHTLSGAYSLDAVSPDEAAAVEAEMLRSDYLRGEIAELTDTAVLLGLAVGEQTPPPALRGRLLDAVAELPQLPAESSVEQEELAESAPATRLAPLSSEARHAVPVGRGRRLRRRPAVLLSLAAVVALLFGGGLALDRLTNQPQSAYVALAEAPDVQTISSPVSGGGTATVSWSNQVGETAVVLHGVTRPAGKVLQLWRIKGDTVTSAGLYVPNSDRHAVMKGALTPGEKLALTVEPVGGSKRPTNPPRILASV